MMPGVSFGLGYDFTTCRRRAGELVLGVEVFGRYPFNSYLLPQWARTLGWGQPLRKVAKL